MTDAAAIDLAIAEYEAFIAGEPNMLAHQVATRGGYVEYCGDPADGARWTATYVRAEDDAVTPLAVGSWSHVVDVFKRLDEAGAKVWDKRDFPRPSAVLGGRQHFFKAGRGRVLVGVAAAEKACVLLVALERRLAAVYLKGRKPMVLHIGKPTAFGEVDVDSMLEFHRSAATRSRSTRVVPSSTRAHHLRIVEGTPVDVGVGPALSRVVRHAFDDLAERASEPESRQKNRRVCGKTRVRDVVDRLHELVVAGCRDLRGRAGQIASQLEQRFPGFKISPEALGDVLRLLLATGTPIVRLASPYVWHIKLAGLSDPDSEHHRKFCTNTTGICRIHDVAEAPAPGVEVPSAPAMAPEAARGVGQPVPDLVSLLTTPGNTPEAARTPEPVEREPGPEAGQAQAAVMASLVLVGARIAVARARDEAAQVMAAARAAWSAERNALESQLREASGERDELRVRVERAEGETHAVRDAAEAARTELVARIERAEAEACAATAAAIAARTELLARVEQLEAELRPVIASRAVHDADLVAQTAGHAGRERAEASSTAGEPLEVGVRDPSCPASRAVSKPPGRVAHERCGIEFDGGLKARTPAVQMPLYRGMLGARGPPLPAG